MNEVKSVKVAFEGRRTGMGAITEYTLYSIKQEKKLSPVYSDSSKTGNHWTDYYNLVVGNTYAVACQDISNAGNHRCYISLISIEEDGRWQKISGKVPEFVKPPCKCLVEEVEE